MGRARPVPAGKRTAPAVPWTVRAASPGLAPSAACNYTVAAVDAAGNTSPFSTAVPVTTLGDTSSSVLARDNFNRPNGGLGANWTVIDSNPVIFNQQVRETNASDGN